MAMSAAAAASYLKPLSAVEIIRMSQVNFLGDSVDLICEVKCFSDVVSQNRADLQIPYSFEVMDTVVIGKTRLKLGLLEKELAWVKRI